MADILFSEVTTGLPTGNGYFDVLMRSVKAHIEIEYNANRIKGPDYTTVYLGAMQSAMQLAEQFVLGEKLQEAQIADIEKGIVVKTQQIASMVLEDGIKQAQSDKDLLVKQEQIDMSIAQQLTEAQQTLDVTKATEVKTQQIASMVVEDGIKSVQSTKDLLVKDNQIAEIAAKIISMGVDDSLKTAQDAEVLAGTVREDLKSTSEIALKAAQTLLVGKQDLTEVQKALLVARQTKGFQDDKSVKIFKAQLDAKSVVYSVAPSELTVPTYDYTEVLT